MPNENTHLWENEKSKQCGKAFDCSTSPAFTWLQPRWPAVFTRVQFTSAGILGTFYPRFLWFAFHMASERIRKIGVFCKADINMFPKHLKWPFDCFSFLTVFFSIFTLNFLFIFFLFHHQIFGTIYKYLHSNMCNCHCFLLSTKFSRERYLVIFWENMIYGYSFVCHTSLTFVWNNNIETKLNGILLSRFGEGERGRGRWFWPGSLH